MSEPTRLTNAEFQNLESAVQRFRRAEGALSEQRFREETGALLVEYGERLLAELKEYRAASNAAREPGEDLEARVDAARPVLLQSLVDVYKDSPTAMATRDSSDPEFDILDRAARDLYEEELIDAKFSADRTTFTARITKKGRDFWRFRRR